MIIDGKYINTSSFLANSFDSYFSGVKGNQSSKNRISTSFPVQIYQSLHLYSKTLLPPYATGLTIHITV